jgi:hypothetical protein
VWKFEWSAEAPDPEDHVSLLLILSCCWLVAIGTVVALCRAASLGDEGPIESGRGRTRERGIAGPAPPICAGPNPKSLDGRAHLLPGSPSKAALGLAHEAR